MIARHIEGVPCAAGCGALAAAGRIYCYPCLDAPDEPEAPLADPDIQVLVLRERLANGGPIMRRLARYGASACCLCSEPALPGRLYCSDGCRWRARRGQAFKIELDGVVARPLEHAARRGVAPSTLYRRLQLGMSLEAALTVPVNEVMRRRRSGEATGEGDRRWGSFTN